MGETVQQGVEARGRERGERFREKAGSRKTSMGDMINPHKNGPVGAPM